MKKFNQFSEDADKVAALRARQKAAVAKYKTTDSTPSKPKASESEVHQGDIATDDLRLSSVLDRRWRYLPDALRIQMLLV